MDSVVAGVEAERELRRLARILLRDAYARGITPARAAQLGDEAFALLEAHVVDEPLCLRVRVDGVYRDGGCLFESDPSRDAHAFRLFQHGVREIRLSPGIERAELADLMAVIGTDWEAPEHLEDDIVTRFGGMQLEAVSLVVVETFTESGGDGDEDDLRGVVEAGLRASIEPVDDEASEAQTLIRLGEADVQLVDQVSSGYFATRLAGTPEAQAADRRQAELAGALAASVSRPGPWLVGAALTIAEVCDASERARLRDALTHQLEADAMAGDPAAALSKLLAAREQARRPGTDAARVDELVGPALQRLAVLALRGDGDSVARAIAVLGAATDAQPDLVAHVARLAPSEARDHALTGLCERTEGVAPRLLELLPSLDEAAACAALQGLRAAPLEPDTLALFRAALDAPHARVRVRGLGWMNYQAPDHAVRELGERLRGDDRVLRLAALWLVLRSRPSVGRALITTWVNGDSIESLDFPERCLAILALVQVVGAAALPALRESLSGGSLFRRRSRAERGAAIAGLGALGDEASLPQIRKLTKKGADDPVGTQANRVIEAIDEGRAPYPSALELVRGELDDLGVLDDLRASEPAEGRPVTERPPARRSTSLASFAVRSSSLSTAPPPRPASAIAPPSLPDAPELAQDLPLPDLDLAEPAAAALRAPRAPAIDVPEPEASEPPSPRPAAPGFRPPSAPPPRAETPIRPPSRPPASGPSARIRPPSRVPAAARPGFRPPSDAPPKKPPMVRPPTLETTPDGLRPPRLLRRRPTEPAPPPTAEQDLAELEAMFAELAGKGSE